VVIGCQKDGNAGQVRWWDAQTWKMKRAFDQEECMASVLFSANGKMLCQRELQELHPALGCTKRRAGSFPEGRQSVGWRGFVSRWSNGRDGGKVWQSATLGHWDTQTGDLKETLKGHGSEIYSLAFSPDGKTLASVSQDGTLRLWPINQGTVGAK
jgi:WD40 repeat protein